MYTLNLTLPTCWQELTQTQLRYVFFLMTQNYTADEVKTYCLCRFSGLQVLGKEDNGYCVLYENNPHIITAVQIAEQLPRLAWLDELPLVPLRLLQIGKHNAVAADLSGVPFSDYLALDNLYTGYLQTQRNDLLREMAVILYKAEDITLTDEEAISIFYWFASLKAYFQRRFRYLFAPSTDGNLLGDTASMADKLQSAMDNQIRALTKGDVTKEEQVLQADTIRALTELDAMAREYQDLQKEIRK
ncbi:MAG: hypothetical protein E7074_06520 [Bacteroidales bacterium]|nr:hypothetical protein [Bacteroidales bacterium]